MIETPYFREILIRKSKHYYMCPACNMFSTTTPKLQVFRCYRSSDSRNIRVGAARQEGNCVVEPIRSPNTFPSLPIHPSEGTPRAPTFLASSAGFAAPPVHLKHQTQAGVAYQMCVLTLVSSPSLALREHERSSPFQTSTWISLMLRELSKIKVGLSLPAFGHDTLGARPSRLDFVTGAVVGQSRHASVLSAVVYPSCLLPQGARRTWW